MKRFVLFSFLALALVFSMAQANAGLIVNLTLDEFGNGTSNGNALFSGLIPDPTGGVIVGNVLIYQLPFVTVQGDVILSDSAVAVVVGDVLRFVTIANNGFVIFYSDNGDGVDAVADISGLPGNSPFVNNGVTILELGPEGANGAVYTPTAGQPGFASTDFTPTYNIISDGAVPEPGSVLLIAAGLAGIGLLKFRR